jgi:hypothetical protein
MSLRGFPKAGARVRRGGRAMLYSEKVRKDFRARPPYELGLVRRELRLELELELDDPSATKGRKKRNVVALRHRALGLETFREDCFRARGSKTVFLFLIKL